MNKKITIIVLIFISVLSLFLNNYKRDAAPPCFDADEAAFSYNAYSLLKTGKDEYGATLPLRLKSFGDYKMPLYTYLSTPFIALFGLNEISARALNITLSVLFPILIYFFAKELFKRDDIALLSAFLISTSLGLQIIARHTHEAYLSAFLAILTAYAFLKVQKKLTVISSLFFLLSIFLLLFSYHPGRIFAAYFFICLLIWTILQRKITGKLHSKQIFLIVGFILISSLSIFTDVIYKPERVKNLLFFKNIGFSLKINELRAEGGSRILYNKVTIGVREFAHQYARYFSPEFLAINGDENIRFGFPSMSPLSLLEYAFFWIGLYYIFKKKEPWRFFLVGLLLISPVSAALSWAGMSLTRSLALFALFPLFSSYGAINFINDMSRRYRIVVIGALIVIELFFLFFSWDFYLNHYPKRPQTIRSWQCGYRELADYVKTHYNTTNTFYITKKNGEPYIFLLFYLKYSPQDYQKQAHLSPPDEYGFGQVERFDRFDFNFRLPADEQNYVAIGYPDDFAGTDKVVLKNIKKITVGSEEVFWIYEKQ